jgi:hypothetical protein
VVRVVVGRIAEDDSSQEAKASYSERFDQGVRRIDPVK